MYFVLLNVLRDTRLRLDLTWRDRTLLRVCRYRQPTRQKLKRSSLPYAKECRMVVVKAKRCAIQIISALFRLDRINLCETLPVMLA